MNVTVLADKEFWLMLEFTLSGWFRACEDRSLRGCWCDGFVPRSATDTRHGVEVHGNAWIADGRKMQREYSFVVLMPQSMLGRQHGDVALRGVDIDVEHERLRFAVEASARSGASPEE